MCLPLVPLQSGKTSSFLLFSFSSFCHLPPFSLSSSPHPYPCIPPSSHPRYTGACSSSSDMHISCALSIWPGPLPISPLIAVTPAPRLLPLASFALHRSDAPCRSMLQSQPQDSSIPSLDNLRNTFPRYLTLSLGEYTSL
jgi:hypothetical protein